MRELHDRGTPGELIKRGMKGGEQRYLAIRSSAEVRKYVLSFSREVDYPR